jgi:hypothetical protein
MNVAQLGQRIGRNPQFLSRIEQGLETEIDRDTLEAFAKILWRVRTEVCIQNLRDDELLKLLLDVPKIKDDNQLEFMNDLPVENENRIQPDKVYKKQHCLLGMQNPTHVQCSSCRKRFTCWFIG